MAGTKKTDPANLTEFTGADGQSVAADPHAGGNAHRPADHSAGETTYAASTKSEVLAKIMQDLQARSGDEVLDVFKSLTAPDMSQNTRPADKTSGETGIVSTSPTAVHGKTSAEPTTSTHGVSPASGKGETGMLRLSPTSVSPTNAREDVSDIFNSDDLTEELRDRAAVVYEAAVNSRLTIITTRLEEEYSKALEEGIDNVHAQMVEAVDRYMNYMAAQWLEKNQVAVESTLKVEMAETFLTGLKDLFENNNVNLSEEKNDTVTTLTNEVEALKAKLNEAVDQNITLREQLTEDQVDETIREYADTIETDSQREKFVTLAENVSFDTVDELKEKLDIIKSRFFVTEVKESKVGEQLTETIENDEDGNTEIKISDHNMQAVFDSIKRSVKN